MAKAKPLNWVIDFLILLTISLSIEPSLSDPRSQVIEFKCGKELENNRTQFMSNFIATMEGISEQMREQGFGRIVVGTGPDTNYGLAQCYGDLTLLDCVLCYAQARTVLPSCFPFNAGTLFLDGCFMRVQNYSFFDEIRGPDDKIVCGNRTQKGLGFGDSARRGLRDAVERAVVGGGGYGRSRVGVSGVRGESVYVLANCWRTLNGSGCRACLDAAVEGIEQCLSWSEGRALHTGCCEVL